MTEARHVNDVRTFSELLVASSLISESDLRSLTNDFRAQVASEKLPDASLTTFTSYLVASGCLTCWQYAKLRNGQWKGFFLDQYKFLDFLGHDENCSRFLAERTFDRQRVVLAMTPLAVARGPSGEFLYTVEDYNPDRDV